MKKILSGYFLSCLFLTRDDIDKILKHHKFNFSASKVNKLLNAMYLIDNKFYSKSKESEDGEFAKIQKERI